MNKYSVSLHGVIIGRIILQAKDEAHARSEAVRIGKLDSFYDEALVVELIDTSEATFQRVSSVPGGRDVYIKKDTINDFNYWWGCPEEGDKLLPETYIEWEPITWSLYHALKDHF